MAKAIATRIGCDMAHISVVTEGADGTPTFATPVPVPGLIRININPNTTTDTLFYDDGPGDTAAALGKIEVEIEKNALSSSEKSTLLGHSIDSNGALIYGANDAPPWVALGFRTQRSNGKYKYVWLYKGKFTDPEETNETKGDSINFQTDTITGNFVKLDKSYTVNGKAVIPYKIEVDEEDASADATIISKWFTGVVLPGATK